MSADTPCIEWQGYRNEKGYGKTHSRGRTSRAHRVVMAEIHGWDALEGKVVMHLCDNPPCVNPDHLRIGTVAENNRDMYAKGRGWNRKKSEAA